MTKDMTIPLDIHRTTGTDTGSIPNMKRKSTIMHRPEGWHPYAESGIGRTPLHPLPGEVVHLSVLPADPLAGGVPGGVPGDMVACAPVGTEPIRMTWSVNGVSQPEKVLQPRVSGDGRQAAGCGIGPF